MCEFVYSNCESKMKLTVRMCALTTNQSSMKGLSLSMLIRTRKMVNYTWEESSQGKP